MKKILSVFLVICVFVVIGICGCSKKSSPAQSSPPAPNATQTLVAGLPAATQTSIANVQATMTANIQAAETAVMTLTMEANATQTAISQLPAAAQTAIAQETATAIANVGVISGTVTIPGAKPGEAYFIQAVTSLLNIGANATNSSFGVLAGQTSIPYSMTVPAGTYEVIFSTLPVNNLVYGLGGPGFGDYAGVAGSTYPSFPAGANVTVATGQDVTENITGVPITSGISGTVTLPAAVSAPEYYTVSLFMVKPTFTDSASFNSSASMMATYSGYITSGNTISYNLPLVLPGAEYIGAIVDLQSSDNAMGQTIIAAGDYTGYVGPVYILSTASSVTGENFTLSTQP